MARLIRGWRDTPSDTPPVGQSSGSVNQAKGALSGAFKWGWRTRKVMRHPLLDFQMPKTTSSCERADGAFQVATIDDSFDHDPRRIAVKEHAPVADAQSIPARVARKNF